MNYAQNIVATSLANVPIVASAAAASTIVSTSFNTGGNPVRVAACGDLLTVAGTTVLVQLYRYTLAGVSTALGNPQMIVAQSSNAAQGFSIETIDTTVPSGAYNYVLNLVQSNTLTSWGATTGNVINAIELRGARGATGIVGPTGVNADGVGAMNYAQTLRSASLASVPAVSLGGPYSTIVSTTFNTGGNPVRVAACGDLTTAAGTTALVQLYRYSAGGGATVSTAIGNIQTIVSQSASAAQGFSIETIDTTVPSGAYTYVLNLVQSNGTTSWGSNSGNVINAIELRGARGATGPTGPNPDGVGAMSYAQTLSPASLANVPAVASAAAASTIVSTTIHAGSNPVRVAACGDLTTAAGTTALVQLYRYSGSVSTAIGNVQTIVGQSANGSQGFSIETIDTFATSGAYTYALNLVQSNGTTSWGSNSGNVMNVIELRGAKGPTGPNPDGVGPMNYNQTISPSALSNVPAVASAATLSTVVSTALTTTGYPVRVVANGDVMAGMGGTVLVQLYRYLGSVSTAIGTTYTIVAGAANQSQGYSVETIDTAPPSGAYTYALNVIQSNGVTNWGQYSGTSINAMELRGARGPSGLNVLTSNNTFSGANTFTSSLTASTLVTTLTNTSTQNTQIYQAANSSITSSFSAVQASFVNAGITYNTLALNPLGGNVTVSAAGASVFVSPLTTNGTVITSGSNGFLSVSSDARLKTDIHYLTDTAAALSTVMELRPATFRFTGTKDERLGFIAQDVEKAIPLAVDGKKYEWVWETREDGSPLLDQGGFVWKLDESGNKIIRPRGLSDVSVVAMLTLAVQELTAQNEKLLAWAQSQGFTGFQVETQASPHPSS
jgi:hypothetical protein